MIKEHRKQIIICLMILLFVLLLLFLLNSYRLEAKTIEINSNNDIITKEMISSIYQYIKSIDKTVLPFSLINECNGRILTTDQKMDMTMQYIIQHYSQYQSQIITLDKQFAYTVEGQERISLGYMNTLFFKAVCYDLLGVEEPEITNYTFYDQEDDLVAIVPTITDNIELASCKMINLVVQPKDEYILTMEYERNFLASIHHFKVDYFLKKDVDRNRYYLIMFQIYDSLLHQ